MGKNKGGRPKIDIKQKEFEALCHIQCTKNEICDVFDIDEKTLTRWCKETYNMGFSDIYKKKSAYGKASLRRNQFELAKKSYAMAIFLGKQYLNQRDVPELEEKANGVLDELTEAIKNAKNS